MTSGNGAEPSGGEPTEAEPPGEEPAFGEDVGGGTDTAAEPAPAQDAERPRPPRRKAGVEYRPV